MNTFLPKAGAAVAASLLLLSACGGSDDPTSNTGGDSQGPSGGPVTGGTLRMVMASDGRSLDPVTMANTHLVTATVGQALYGSMVTNDPVTGKISPGLANWTTADDGKTWDVEVTEGVTYSDGTPLKAADIQVNFERCAEPTSGCAVGTIAAYAKSFKVIDDRHLKVTLVAQNANYPDGVVNSSLNWIAKPEALKAGQASFDKNPIGAGPFVLKSWTRGSAMELTRNENYYQQGKPYLDALSLTVQPDPMQRVTTVATGGADLVLGSDNNADHKAADTPNVVVHTEPIGGANMLLMNQTKAPFNDARAREAMDLAIDRDALNTAVFDGTAVVADGWFAEGSPFADANTGAVKPDPARAQELFDEIAADGKPLSFTIKVGPSLGGTPLAEAIQAQMKKFKNVDVKVESVDITTWTMDMVTKNYEMLPSGTLYVDPESPIWSFFHSDSTFNPTGVADEQLSSYLDEARVTADVPTRLAAYKKVAARIDELHPVVRTFGPVSSMYSTEKVGGVAVYGIGSPLLEELWLSK